jgi:hypothetical protein
MGSRRDAAKNEHTLNIRSGIAVLNRDFGLHIDEFDFIDASISHLRDIKNFGTTEYLAILKVNEKGEATLPCNLDVIDAVMSEKMGLKAFADRVRYTLSDDVNNDDYFQSVAVMDSIGFDINRQHYSNGYRDLSYEMVLPGLTDHKNSEGYLSYHLEGKIIKVKKTFAGDSVAVAFTGISTDPEGYPLINFKQSNALAALAAKVITIKKASRGDKNAASMLQYLVDNASRLKQAASIPEHIADNEIDSMLDAQVSFGRKTYKRPTTYNR